MRILMVATTMGKGGIQSVVSTLAETLAEQGDQIRIVSLYGEDSVQTSSLVERAELRAPSGLLGRLIAAKRLAEEIRLFDPDVVHSHAVHANVTSAGARLFTRAPFTLVRTVHSVVEGGRTHAVLMRLTRPLADAHVVVSNAVGEAHVSGGALQANSYTCVNNGVDVERFKFRSSLRTATREQLGVDSQPLIINVGRLTAAKDHDLLLHAFRLVLDRLPNAVLALVGAGELDTKLRAVASDLGISDHVRFLGERSDVPALLTAADLFLLSSAWEGFPVCILEARGSNLPIVARDVGGVAEALGGSGVLVPRPDPVVLARAAVEALIRAESADRECIESAIAEQISLATMTARWVGVYQKAREADAPEAPSR
jgi:glycosyltransferase involved in cell wall biosynthesis